MEEISKGIGVIKLLRQVMDALRQNMKQQYKDMNLTGPQVMVMHILAHHGEMKISALSEKLGLSNSTVSGILDRLEKQGLVERTRSKEDRRVVYVNASAEFGRNAQEHHQEIERKFAAMMHKATPEELDTILQGLDTLKKVMDRNKHENSNSDNVSTIRLMKSEKGR